MSSRSASPLRCSPRGAALASSVTGAAFDASADGAFPSGAELGAAGPDVPEGGLVPGGGDVPGAPESGGADPGGGEPLLASRRPNSDAARRILMKYIPTIASANAISSSIVNR